MDDEYGISRNKVIENLSDVAIKSRSFFMLYMICLRIKNVSVEIWILLLVQFVIAIYL